MIKYKDWLDYKKQFTGTSTYYNILQNAYLTDGTKAMGEKLECFWLFEELKSFIPLIKKYGFIVFKINSKDNSATIDVQDGNYNSLAEKHIKYTDLPEGEYEIWSATTSVNNNIAFVFYLPEEH